MGKFLVGLMPSSSDAIVSDTAQILRLACTHGLAEVLKALFARSRSSDGVGGKTGVDTGLQELLASVCADGYAGAAKVLIQQQADPNFVDASGVTPIAVACDGQHADVVKTLVECGAKTNVVAAPFIAGDEIVVNAHSVAFDDDMQAMLSTQAGLWDFDGFVSKSRCRGQILEGGRKITGAGDW